eukprot:5348980-Amphidinium_carterae.1
MQHLGHDNQWRRVQLNGTNCALTYARELDSPHTFILHSSQSEYTRAPSEYHAEYTRAPSEYHAVGEVYAHLLALRAEQHWYSVQWGQSCITCPFHEGIDIHQVHALAHLWECFVTLQSLNGNCFKTHKLFSLGVRSTARQTLLEKK